MHNYASTAARSSMIRTTDIIQTLRNTHLLIELLRLVKCCQTSDLVEPCNRMRMRCDMGFISSQGESLPPQDGITGESLHPGSHSILWHRYGGPRHEIGDSLITLHFVWNTVLVMLVHQLWLWLAATHRLCSGPNLISVLIYCPIDWSLSHWCRIWSPNVLMMMSVVSAWFHQSHA